MLLVSSSDSCCTHTHTFSLTLSLCPHGFAGDLRLDYRSGALKLQLMLQTVAVSHLRQGVLTVQRNDLALLMASYVNAIVRREGISSDAARISMTYS